MKQKVVDIESKDEVLVKSDNLINALDSGIQAITLDFGYHIKNTFDEPKIFELRNNISYRLSSSRFHFHLLFKELNEIQSKHANLKVSGDIRDNSMWHIETDKRHLSYILDSIIFHLSSVFDYSAILIHYILTKNYNVPNWNKIESHARAGSGLFSHQTTIQIKESILDIHNNFVRHLYDYRSDIIHRKADILSAEVAHEIHSNRRIVLFLCSNMQQKKFKNLGTVDNRYSVTYFTQFLILQTIESIANILRVLRNYMEENSNNDALLKEGKIMFAYYGENKELTSPATMYWNAFDQIFHEASFPK